MFVYDNHLIYTEILEPCLRCLVIIFLFSHVCSVSLLFLKEAKRLARATIPIVLRFGVDLTRVGKSQSTKSRAFKIGDKISPFAKFP